ncbi:hypothetical protein D9619_007453 [Psilocybe cf. subviscida]|uniref:Uncharacterized protein n=1 Tax=Psilocybe cf. subviscida TaxID=2480587 RepID=A0A8H5B266_9AGAR|nr:hypothetical protein D9619_007453 [Psilocybe cf. subviscida]
MGSLIFPRRAMHSGGQITPRVVVAICRNHVFRVSIPARFVVCNTTRNGNLKDPARHMDAAPHQFRHESSLTTVDVTCAPDK